MVNNMIAIYNGYEPIDYSKVIPLLFVDESGFENIILQGLNKAYLFIHLEVQ